MAQRQTRKILGSWKAIANHFDCSERTVRRWETQEHLPVHRHQHLSGARIFAYEDELDAWFVSRSQQKSATPPPPQKLRIAVLPFDLVSDDESKAYIRDAICEDMVADLASLKSLVVISYASMRFLPEDRADAFNALKAMQLNLFVEGNIRIESARINMNLRLINSQDQAIVWSSRFNAALTDAYPLRQQALAALLNSLPSYSEEDAFTSSGMSALQNETAWEYVHRARSESLKWQPQTIARAIDLLNAARKMAGDEPIVLASLGRAHLQLREAGIDCSDKPIRDVETILAGLQRQAPNAFYTHSLNGWYHYVTGQMDDAIASLNLALALHPNDPDALGLLSNCYLVTGQNALAAPLVKALQIVDPLTPLSRCAPGWLSLLEGDFTSAVKPYEQMLAMDPHNPVARLFMTWVYALTGNMDGMSGTCEGIIPPLRHTLPATLAFAIQRGVCGEPGQIALTEQQVEVASVNEMFARFVAFALCANQDVEQATLWLEKAFHLGFRAYPFMRDHDPFFRPYQDYPTLKTLMQKIKFTWERQAISR